MIFDCLTLVSHIMKQIRRDVYTEWGGIISNGIPQSYPYALHYDFILNAIRFDIYHKTFLLHYEINTNLTLC